MDRGSCCGRSGTPTCRNSWLPCASRAPAWASGCRGRTRGYDALDAQAWFDICADNLAAGSSYDVGVYSPDGRELYGGVAVSDVHSAYNMGNLGYWIRASRQRQGLASRAAAMMACFAFHRLRLTRLEIVAAEHNAASRGVAEDRRAVRMHRAQPPGHARAAMRGCGLFAGAGIVRPASLGGEDEGQLPARGRALRDRPARRADRALPVPDLPKAHAAAIPPIRIPSGRPARAEPPRGPARRHAGAQKVVRRPTLTLRPASGAMSRSREVALRASQLVRLSPRR